MELLKVSLRSGEKIDVSVVASYFGGGRTRKSTGFSMTATPHDIINNLARRLELQFNSGERSGMIHGVLNVYKEKAIRPMMWLQKLRGIVKAEKDRAYRNP